MDCEDRLKAAAHFILSNDRRIEEDPPLDCSALGVSAVLKPHQVDGVSWLIRRYRLGVNVILGIFRNYPLRAISYIRIEYLSFVFVSVDLNEFGCGCRRRGLVLLLLSYLGLDVSFSLMGLGKTLQAISFLSYLKVQHHTPGPFMVLCPLSVTDGWVSEFANFCPTLRVLRYVGEKEFRRGLRRTVYEHVMQQPSSSDVQSALPFDVLLTTYDIVLLDQDFLCQIPWHYTVIDEAQRLKNPSSVLYSVLEQRFVIPRRLLMTGTPIQNNLSELWALMHFCMPSIFATLEQFISTFSEAGRDAAEIKERFKFLKYVLRAFMLRRTKAMLVESGSLMLPPLTEITVMAPLVVLQKKVYISILRRELPQLLAVSSGASSHQSLQNTVIQLRKACSHPYLFPGIEPEPYEEGEHLVQASGKLIVLDQLLHKLQATGHRVLLFAQMTHTLDILQDFLELRRYTYERLDGSIRAEERFAAIRSFSQQPVKDDLKTQANQHGAFVFMISTRAGGVGLNLVAADTVIFYEQDWNPQVDKQALQRAHRIGQMNHVLSINLVTEHSVEEVVMRRAERKLQLSYNVVGGDNDNHGEGKEIGAEPGDLRSLIFGLHLFDPTDIKNEDSVGVNMEELNAMAEKLSPSIENSTVELGRKRNLSDTRLLKQEFHKKAEEKKLAKWEALGYKSLAVKDPICDMDGEIMSDSGSVQFVYGDCTKPSKVCPSEPAIIFSCIDNSGNWGRGGMFDALANLSGAISDAYCQASECGDLHLGDLHLIKINEGEDENNMDENAPQWVALAVVQSYNPRRKVPRSNISIPDLEQCLLKASFSAAQNSGTITGVSLKTKRQHSIILGFYIICELPYL
ncbi:putative helicase CHR10 isoform X1 [Cinnamomum micranthum f. kanehirae]|uniref:Putative helicase CHR10 isoform X1 n=1 Tax=Cinnamomum micranthum f. kanehirae TaxID=337451 RepID=A0A3S3N2P8_9MAGN|nr:putative helicase CHR10 isoform X1 [Cinnamomum micranthum f. kanehirae]